MSIHTDRARAKANSLGAFAGIEIALPLWKLSKRELIEIAIRLGASAVGECDSAEVGIGRAIDEVKALRENGII